MNRKTVIILLVLTAVALIGVPGALATSDYLADFNAKYGTGSTRLNTCDTCHVSGQPKSVRNPYGVDLDHQLINMTSDPSAANQSTVNQALTNIEPLDSDGDGFINIDEIHNLTFPGNASDHPTIAPTGAPNITSFSPTSPVMDTVGANRTFSITVNQTVNVTWYINGTLVQTNMSVTTASYTNTSAALGTWNVTAVARNVNGTDMQKWDWIVKTAVTPTPTVTVTATPTVTLTATPTVTRTPRVTETPEETGTPRVTRTPGGPPTAVPEFPNLVLPIAAVIGLMTLLLYRRKK